MYSQLKPSLEKPHPSLKEPQPLVIDTRDFPRFRESDQSLKEFNAFLQSKNNRSFYAPQHSTDLLIGQFFFFCSLGGGRVCSRNSLPGPHSPPLLFHHMYQHLDHPWPIAHILFSFFCSFGGGSSVVEAQEIAFPAHTPHPHHYIPCTLYISTWLTHGQLLIFARILFSFFCSFGGGSSVVEA